MPAEIKIRYDQPIEGLSQEGINEIYGIRDASGEYDSLENLKQYFIHRIRFACTFWNRPLYIDDGSGNHRPIGTGGTGINGGSVSPFVQRSSYPVDQIRENRAYYLAEQQNLPYAYLTRMLTGKADVTPHIPGQKVFTVIDFMEGSFAQAIRGAKPRCIPVSKRAQSVRDIRLNMAQIAVAMKGLLQQAAQEGLMMAEDNVLKEGVSEDNIAEILEQTPSDMAEEFGTELISKIIARNNFETALVRAFREVNYEKWVAFHVRVQDGNLVLDRVASECVFFDNRYDCDYNSKSLFRGIVEELTLSEITSRGYKGFDTSIHDEMLAIQEGKESPLGSYIGQNTSSKMSIDFYNSDKKTFSVATVYYVGSKDLGIKRDPATGEYRHKKKGEQTGDIIKPVIYAGVLIANKYLVNWGEFKGIPIQPGEDPSNAIPIVMMAPGITKGIVKCVADRIKDLSDQYDAIKTVVRKKLKRAKGKVPVLNSAAFTGKTNAQIQLEIESWGYVLANFAGDSAYDPNTGKKIIDYMDFTMDSDIKTLMELAAEEERLIDNLYSTHPMIVGSSRTQVGLGVQRNNISQATLGLSNRAEAFAKFGANVLQVAVNLGKTYYATEEGKKAAEFLFSQKVINWLSLTKPDTIDAMGVYVTLLDRIDDFKRDKYFMLAQTLLPQGVDPEVLKIIVDLGEAETSTELRKSIDAVVRTLSKKRAEQYQADMMMKAAGDQAKNQVPIQKEEIAQRGEDRRAVLKHFGAQQSVE